MKQSEVHFKTKNYIDKRVYLEDGCPTRYFEFDKHEYYGLISATTPASEFEQYGLPLVKVGTEKAYQNYLDFVGGETLQEIKAEGHPKEISKSEALLKFLLAEDNKNETVDSLVRSFEQSFNDCLLVDGSLV